ncbi:MAG: SDR family oxidoreductase [Anaerolineae bacterium]|nr:SDR family oxidoreductase [Anaerolineae bacterium]
MTPENCRQIIDTNLTGAIVATHYSLPLLAAGVHLMYIGVVSERIGLSGLRAYTAAKAGLEAFIEGLGKKQRQQRVLNIRPSAIDTPLWQKVPAHALTQRGRPRHRVQPNRFLRLLTVNRQAHLT